MTESDGCCICMDNESGERTYKLCEGVCSTKYHSRCLYTWISNPKVQKKCITCFSEFKMKRNGCDRKHFTSTYNIIPYLIVTSLFNYFGRVMLILVYMALKIIFSSESLDTYNLTLIILSTTSSIIIALIDWILDGYKECLIVRETGEVLPLPDGLHVLYIERCKEQFYKIFTLRGLLEILT